MSHRNRSQNETRVQRLHKRVDRPKPWRARYRTPDGRTIPKSFRRKVDAEKWLLLGEGDVLAGRWHDPQSGTELFSVYCEKWLEETSPTVGRKQATTQRQPCGVASCPFSSLVLGPRMS